MHIALIASFDQSLLNFRGPLIRTLVAQGHRVTVFAPFTTVGVRDELQAMGAATADFALQRTGTNPVADLRTWLALRRRLRQSRPDLVLSYTIKPVIYGSLAARAAGVPSINALITGVGNALSATGVTAKIVTGLYRRALRVCNAVIFQNPDDRALFTSLGLVNESQTHVVDGSGVDTAHYAAAPLPDSPRFFLLARLLAEKGIREYVAAARLVKAQRPDAHFSLGGWPDQHANAITDQELQQWQAEGTITFLGALADPRANYADCCVYVLPSYREGTPRTVLEAMSMGRPIITTDTPGCRETVVAGENGLLVPPRDCTELAAAMLRLASEAAMRTRMGAASRRIACERYDVHKVNRDLMHVLGLTD